MTVLRLAACISLMGLLSITVEVGPPAAAQAPLLPYATLRVVAQTNGQVWPGDFNRDGIADLASGADDPSAPGPGGEHVQIALGNGDGTFKPPIVSGTSGMVRAVADINRDGFLDVVAASANGLIVLPGNGNGTLQAARGVTTEGGFGDGFVLVVDLNADGRRDLALPMFVDAAQFVGIFPGRGDFTFSEPVLLPLDSFSLQPTTGDFDGDGRIDIAVAHDSIAGTPGQLSIYLNEGMFQFTRNTVAVPKGATDVTTRDLDGDGDLDLTVTGSTYSGFSYAFDGFLYIFRGDGNGGFTLTGTYTTAIGPIAVVVGDFTHDGRLDVATANLSFRVIEDCAFIRPADSVSILPGNGDGTFGETTTFALGSQAYGADLFGDDVDSLNTADLNRDGFPDLIASDGRLLITAAPRANRPPVVDAGEGMTEPGAGTIFLQGGGTDPDGHLLSFRVTDKSGRIDFPSSFGCIESLAADLYALTMTASDGRAQASDTVVFDFRFKEPGPPGWTTGDIGNVGAAGSAVFNPQESQFTVIGSGADIWNRADAFHFDRTSVTGDFSISAMVDSVENVNVWTKAGIMIREGTAPGARHASLFVTPTTAKGIAFQRRTSVGGLSVHTAGPARTAPVMLLLKRTGDLISAYYADEPFSSRGWILIGREVISGLATTLNVGLAVTSHVNGTLATARFSHVGISDPSGFPTSADIGAVGVPGTGNFSATSGEIQGSGADIWGTADAFYFFRQWWTADGTATVRVQSLEPTHRWAKLGLMFRETSDPRSRHVMLIVSANAGLAMQYRGQFGGASTNVALTPGAAPEWLRLHRSGNTFIGYASEDGRTWRTVGSLTLPLDLDTFAGVAITSHDNTTLASGVFDSFSIVR